MTAKTVLITGANQGIGLSLAKQYKQKQWRVLGTARKPEAADELKKVADEVYQLDVTSQDSIDQLAQQVKDKSIDLLINNAGIYQKQDPERMKMEAMVDEYKVNALGPLFVSYALKPQLLKSKSPRIVNMTSRMGSIEDNTSGGNNYGYRASKAALNALTKTWSINEQVPAVLTHPGPIKTSMTQGRGEMEPDDCATCLIKLYDEFMEDSNVVKFNGKFLHRDGHELPW